MLCGFVGFVKPVGYSTRAACDVVARALRLPRGASYGHSGTLDPAASGVVVLGVGAATKLLRFLAPTKRYVARLKFGLGSESGDLEAGSTASVSTPVSIALPELRARVAAAIPSLVGEAVTQVPPANSAVSFFGERAYELVKRVGATAANEAMRVHKRREVSIYGITIGGWCGGPTCEFPEILLFIDCGGGVYVRSIARDLGVLVGLPSLLAGLERTSSGGFGDAGLKTVSFADLVRGGRAAALAALVPPEACLSHLGAVTLSPRDEDAWAHGAPAGVDVEPRLRTSLIATGSDVCVYEAGGRFIGIASVLLSSGARIVVRRQRKMGALSSGD